jgi:hypothetical protein
MMVEKAEFMQLLLLLLRERNMNTRREAILTAKLIAIENFGRSRLFVHGGKLFVDAISESIQYMEVKVASLEVLVHLICRETAMIICKHGSLLNLLTSIASDISCIKSALLAAQTIKRLSTHIPVSGKGKGALLEAMVHLLSSENHRIRYWGARAFLEQSQMQACSFFMMRAPHVVKILADLAMDENPAVKASGIAIVLNLASNPLNLRILAKNRVLLDALACAVVECGQVDDVTRRNAVLAILHLANHQKSKKMVAKQHNIVASLSRYGVSQDDDTELKSAALHGVIWLAPHM